ncbi:MAG: hypothetical protein EON58_15745 [Alphaproteobacteria bacterium]|nr:MAG: hypothetical protein EON58_15745 [Alphaproteobacteria bacterium]
MGDAPQPKQSLTPAPVIQVNGQNVALSGGEVIIPSGQFAFLLTDEFVHIPVDAMGFISLKSKQKWKGLINVSGFHVDPGFNGRLVYSVYNAGPANIHLTRGQPMFLLWIADLDPLASQNYAKPQLITQSSISTGLISEVDRPLHSLGSLSERIESLQSELTLIYRVLAAIAVILGLALAIWALLPNSEDRAEASKSATTDVF